MTDTPSRGRPTIAEVAALTARLRALSRAGRDADRDEVDRFLADKRDLIDRINAADDAAEAGHSTDADDGPVADRGIPPDADGRQLPPLPDDWQMPPEMIEGIEERRTDPAQVDDPAELQARTEALRQRVVDRARAVSRDAATLDRTARDDRSTHDSDGSDRTDRADIEQRTTSGVSPNADARTAEDRSGPPFAMIAEQAARARSALAVCAEEDRRAQLARWHTDDTCDETLAAGDVDGAAPVRDDRGVG